VIGSRATIVLVCHKVERWGKAIRLETIFLFKFGQHGPLSAFVVFWQISWRSLGMYVWWLAFVSIVSPASSFLKTKWREVGKKNVFVLHTCVVLYSQAWTVRLQTGWPNEFLKIAQRDARRVLFAIINMHLFPWKTCTPIFWAPSVIFKILTQENNRPMGEKSSNLVTLFAEYPWSCRCSVMISSVGSDVEPILQFTRIRMYLGTTTLRSFKNVFLTFISLGYTYKVTMRIKSQGTLRAPHRIKS
jgi:hypothetical protein